MPSTPSTHRRRYSFDNIMNPNLSQKQKTHRHFDGVLFVFIKSYLLGNMLIYVAHNLHYKLTVFAGYAWSCSAVIFQHSEKKRDISAPHILVHFILAFRHLRLFVIFIIVFKIIFLKILEIFLLDINIIFSSLRPICVRTVYVQILV